ncbi:hypothetical protein KCA24_34225, partial [Escherichia coli]|nr:hypothetical protein [Escherichia coli]
MHTLLQMCPVPLAVFTYYIVGIAVILGLSPAMMLTAVGDSVALRFPGPLPRLGVAPHTGRAPTPWRIPPNTNPGVGPPPPGENTLGP